MGNNDYLKYRTYPHCVLNKRNLTFFPGKTNITPYPLKNLDENRINCTEEVIIGSEQDTTFPTKIGTTMCNALIDTGATRSYISEKYCKKLQLAKFIYYKMSM